MTITLIFEESLPARPLYRVLHDAELPGQPSVRGMRAVYRRTQRLPRLPRALLRALSVIWRPGLPEVFPLNDLATTFGEQLQWLAYGLNPGMTGLKFRSLYDYRRAFTNGTGFRGPEPRADYVNGLDLNAIQAALDKGRLCGGATVEGDKDPPYLIVRTLDPNHLPTLEWLWNHPTFRFHAVNTTWAGITRFPQNDGRPCIIPLVSRGICRILLSNLQEVPGIADPYYIGGYQPSPYE